MPFVWIYGKCKRSEDNHHPYPTNDFNTRINEDYTASRRQHSANTMNDAALRRGLQQSRDHYESEIVFQSNLDQAIRASRAQHIIDSNNRTTGRPTTTSSTVTTNDSPIIPTNNQASDLWRPGMSSRSLMTEPTPTPTGPMDRPATAKTNESTNRSLLTEETPIGTEEGFIFGKGLHQITKKFMLQYHCHFPQKL